MCYRQQEKIKQKKPTETQTEGQTVIFMCMFLPCSLKAAFCQSFLSASTKRGAGTTAELFPPTASKPD